ALIRRAVCENKTVVVSIFVNPSQFSQGEDFKEYPRDIDSDMKLLESEGVDIVLAPSVDEMYPNGFDTYINIGNVARKLEGEHRLNHFDGVATIVCKLFNISNPDKAYFGKKDAQQCAVIKKLNTDLNLGVKIELVETVRDKDGLALSSRNVHLTESERRSALSINQALFSAVSVWRSGIESSNHLVDVVREILERDTALGIDYVSIVDPKTFNILETAVDGSMICTAVRVGQIRLIDNAMFH
ncbi:MAG: pantoate--beta-alanine ligase, partial [Dehalococcoidia bacterium]